MSITSQVLQTTKLLIARPWSGSPWPNSIPLILQMLQLLTSLVMTQLDPRFKANQLLYKEGNTKLWSLHQCIFEIVTLERTVTAFNEIFAL